MTPATSYAGSANGSAVVAVLPPGTGGVGPQNLSSTGVTTTDLLLLQENPDLLKQLGYYENQFLISIWKMRKML